MNPTARFSSRHKLTRAADFESVLAEGRRSADRLFTVLYRPSGLGVARLGITASARRVRTAVARNRIRRLIRESFRRAKGGLGGLDIVVIVKEAAAGTSNRVIVESLEGHWDRLHKAATAPGGRAN